MWRSEIEEIQLRPAVGGRACPDLATLAADVRAIVRSQCERCETGGGACLMDALRDLAEAADAVGPGGIPVD